MDDRQLLRYSRHLLLPAVDIEGQERFLAARVLVVGAGGLGSAVVLYLAAAGVGHLTIVDPDVVDESNLQRQVMHGAEDLGHPKVDSAARAARRLGADTVIERVPEAFGAFNGEALVIAADVCIDCSDNFATRFLLNRLSVKHRKPLVSGAAIRMEGQLAVFDPRPGDGPCYRCLYPETGEEDVRCSNNGVLAPVVGVIGSLQAVEALKVILGLPGLSAGKLLVWDAARAEFRSHRIRRDPACPVCGGAAGNNPDWNGNCPG
jgi:molybdopterin/thiamine biosynthesis adenylyltransferase